MKEAKSDLYMMREEGCFLSEASSEIGRRQDMSNSRYLMSVVAKVLLEVW